MIKVEKTADNLNDGITNMMQGAKDDYIRMSTSGGKELTGYSLEQVEQWDNKTKVSEGKKYIKIVQDTGVFAFVMKEDSGRFKKGDILKVGMKVNVVQKTKKTPGVITKIMQSKCLVDLSGRIYRVPMSMLEVA